MFISEDEANKRLNSSKNVLTVIDRGGASQDGETHDVEPFVVPLEELIPAEDQSCKSAEGILEAPDGKLLRRLLGMKVSTGRYIGQKEMHKELQAATATTAQLVDTRTAAATFGTSYHHADELKHGYTNQQDRYNPATDPDADLAKVINRQKKEVRDLAFEKLTKALGLISDDKLRAITDATKLARLSKDLSGVVDKVLPKESIQLGGVHFHVWRPEMREESTYETVVVGAQT